MKHDLKANWQTYEHSCWPDIDFLPRDGISFAVCIMNSVPKETQFSKELSGDS